MYWNSTVVKSGFFDNGININMRCIEMHLTQLKVQHLKRLTLTWDVLKSKTEIPTLNNEPGLTLTWDVLKCEDGNSAELQDRININMRCIEISPYSVFMRSTELININMRCIEILTSF